MAHTNDVESDFEGFKLKDIVKNEESDVDLSNEDVLDFFFALCVTLQPRNDVIFVQQCLKDIFSKVIIKYR